MSTTLIQGGRFIDPASDRDETCDLAIADGIVAAIGARARGRLEHAPADRIVHAEGLLVVPGLIDPHVHLREPGHEHKETLATGAHAAAAGGFSTVCCMPNTSPALDTPEIVRWVIDRGAGTSCRIFPVAAATRARRGEEICEFGLLARAGAVGFSDDGDCIASAGMMARVLAAVRAANSVFMQHCQEPTLTVGASMHAGPIAVRLGLTGWPRAAEEVIIERDLRLNRGVGCRYHVQHISSAGSVELVRRARRAGEPVTAEASPHHLLLTHDVCEGYNTLGKVNPPLREAHDVRALVEGVADGTITVLGTDHAPHSSDEKALPFEEAPFGFVGLETALGLYAEALVHSGAIPWKRLIALMTLEPARLCGLESLGLGQLAVGGPADVTLIDPELPWTITRQTFVGRSRNSPFIGRAVRGGPVMTIARGMVTWDAVGERVERRSAQGATASQDG